MRRCLPVIAAFLLLVVSPALCFGENKPELNLEPTSESAASALITMSVDGVSLKDVLKVLSQQTGFNYVASEEVETRRISLNFENVSIDDALQSIAKTNNLEYEKKPGSNIVMFYALPTAMPGQPGGATPAQQPINLETRIFHIHYTRLSGSPLDVGGESTIQDLSQLAQIVSTTSSSSSGGAAAPSAPTAASVSVPNQANLMAAKGIDRIIANLLTPNGKVTSDISNNDLIVTDTAEKLNEIAKILKQLDKPAAQVLIEVHLLEVKKELLTNHGIEWGGSAGKLGTFTAGSRTTGFPFTERVFSHFGGEKATTVDSTQAVSTLTLGTLNASDFTATLHFLTQDVNTKILARPRVLTLNNEAANIKLVTNAAIANQSTLTTAQGQASSTSNTAERTQIGIMLKMTPQINDDDTVGLFLEPSVTTVAASSFFPSTFLDPTTRVIRTIAMVKNHQTLVIGGLIDKTATTNIKKIPVLGDVPFIGKAFSYDAGDDSDRELLIFITPHIVNRYDSFGAENATSFTGRDLAAKRVLDAFRDEDLQKSLDTLENSRRDEEPVLRQEKALIQASADRAFTPAMDKEMTHSLDTLSRKK